MLKKTAIFIIIILFAIQLVSVDNMNPPVNEKITLKAPKEVISILKQSCYDCHSYETRWPSYSSVAPISFFISSHVKNARRAINFSKWREIDKKIKIQRLKRAIVTVNNGRMALPSYVFAHKEAKLKKNEKTILTNWFKKELAALSDNKIIQD